MTERDKKAAESRDEHRYDDMIGMPRPVSENHLQMSRADRAAQFSPFAALTGYEDAIAETGRLTDERMELLEDAGNFLDEKLRLIQERIGDLPEVSVTYFLPDERKAGGAYITVRNRVKKMDSHEGVMIMQDGIRIPFRDIVEIEGEALQDGRYTV